MIEFNRPYDLNKLNCKTLNEHDGLQLKPLIYIL